MRSILKISKLCIVAVACVALCIAVAALLYAKKRDPAGNTSTGTSVVQPEIKNSSETITAEDNSQNEQSPEQRRELMSNALDEMSRIGSPDDPIMKSMQTQIHALSTGLIKTLAQDAPLEEVEQNAMTMELLVDSQVAYVNIEQSHARFVANRILRKIREPNETGRPQTPDEKLLEGGKLLQYMGPEQPFFNKAREQWLALQTALKLNESEEQSTAEINLEETRELVDAAGQCGHLCRLIFTAEELRFTPGDFPFDDLMEKEGINKEITALQETFVKSASVDMEQLQAAGEKLKALVVRAIAAEQTKTSELTGSEE